MKHSSSAAFLALVACETASAFTTSNGPVQRISSSFTLEAKPKIFIDGEAGTTGIQVRERLEKREDLEVISAPFDLRKDVDTRKKLINEADAVILCKFYCLHT
jgi:N-acetyl-gamma-glutamyl-phosphate reductase